MGEWRRNREIKRFCPDFRPVRRVLRAISAERIGIKRQTDTYYRVPAGRLKLREEGGRRELIAYADAYGGGLRAVRYRVVDAQDRAIGAMLAEALGVSVVVRKRREVWRGGRTLFNLDRVEGVGQIFEVEIRLADGDDGQAEAERLLALLAPYLGEAIEGSNEDLAPQAAARPT
ncbi:MAG: class IV adenylate cyclase [Chloroflexota bacterium]|nr:class IV adenylate cyclase [Chloroflexota bacterium]